MKTFELTFIVTTTDNSEIDLTKLERDLSYYDSTDMNLLDIEMIEPDQVHVTFEMKADSIRACPDFLEELNDESVVSDPELYDSERLSYTSY